MPNSGQCHNCKYMVKIDEKAKTTTCDYEKAHGGKTRTEQTSNAIHCAAQHVIDWNKTAY